MGAWHRASSLWGQRASHPASLIKRIKEQVNNRPAEAEDGDGVAERAAAEDEGEGERDAARGAVAGAGGGAGGDVDGVGGIAAEAVGIVKEVGDHPAEPSFINANDEIFSINIVDDGDTATAENAHRLVDKFDNENFLEVEGDRPDVEARNLKKVFDELLQTIDVSG